VHVYNGPAPDEFGHGEATLRKTGAGVLLIDSLSRFLLEDENAAAEVTAALGRLADLVHRTTVALFRDPPRPQVPASSAGDAGLVRLAAFDTVHVKREGDDDHGTRRRLVSVSRYTRATKG